MKTALVMGGNGFIGHHLARRLIHEDYWVRVVDIKDFEYGKPDYADEIIIGDLRDPKIVEAVLRLNTDLAYSFFPEPYEKLTYFDEVYQLAADMGGAGFVFTGENDSDIMHNSATINLNVCNYIDKRSKIFYSSSACMYPQGYQGTTDPIPLKESMAYPADPDSEYGWEKVFSERLFLAYARNKGLDVRIARFHNIYGPEGTYTGGREKAPAAMCRKAIESEKSFSIWGDGNQTRSFLYIDDCIDAVRLLMESDFKDPINIGSEEMVSIRELAQMAIEFSGKNLYIDYEPYAKSIGVRGRNSDNTLIRKVLNWEPRFTLRQGLSKTFGWIKLHYGL